MFRPRRHSNSAPPASSVIRVVEGRVTFLELVSDETRPGAAKAQFDMGKTMANAPVRAVDTRPVRRCFT